MYNMSRKRKGNPIDGIIVLNKPKGISSNHALQRVKHIFNAQKAGHTGSLDPMATGVLPICFGQTTKLSQYLLDSDKEYIATIQLGVRTDSGDAEGNIISTQEVDKFSDNHIVGVLKKFTGRLSQTPPMYSALKHQGQPLYKLARQGIEIKREPRNIEIKSLECLEYNSKQKTIKINVKCTKGTYIRSLAMDIGNELNCGAHLTQLERTACGLLTSRNMVDLITIEDLPIKQQLDLIYNSEYPFTDKPIFTIPCGQIQEFRNSGKIINTEGLNGIVRLYSDIDQFIALAFFNNGLLIKKQLFLQGTT